MCQLAIFSTNVTLQFGEYVGTVNTTYSSKITFPITFNKSYSFLISSLWNGTGSVKGYPDVVNLTTKTNSAIVVTGMSWSGGHWLAIGC